MNTVGRDPLIGRTLDGRYRVRARIARGGMGMVYLADDLRLGRKVAVKAMHAHLVDDETFVRRFEKEAHAAARLNDPHVVNVFDQGFVGEIPYLVMEYVPGITLRELLKQQKRLTAQQALEISEAVLKGLSAAHRAGFIHRDLKPENIFLADDGRIKIGDFGLARAANNNTTTGQALLGTIAYLSPELVTRGVADARSDIYAFGIMLYEMLTGVQPFRGEQAVQVAYMHANTDVPKPSLISREATPELDEMVRWTTVRDPEKRPKDATLVLARLNQLLDGGLEAATRVMDRGQDSPTLILPDSVSLPADADNTAADTGTTQHSDAPLAPIEKAQLAAQQRTKRGLIATGVLSVLLFITVFSTWWFAQGPGHNTRIPDVSSMSLAEATQTLQAAGLELASQSECTSPHVPKGMVVSANPAVGSTVTLGSKIELCLSIGPALLPVPRIVGLPQKEAEATVHSAGFRLGKLLPKRFSDAPVNTVIAALDNDSKALGDTFAEQGEVNLLLSAGALPEVAGLSLKEAQAKIEQAGLVFNPAAGAEEHSDSVPKGQVIALVLPGENVHVGQSVGCKISLGPELVKIPDLTGKRMNEAIAELEALGLQAATGVPGILRNAVRVNSMTPSPGTEVTKGSTVKLGFEL